MDVSDLLGWDFTGDALLHRPAEQDLVDRRHDRAPNRQIDIVGSHPVQDAGEVGGRPDELERISMGEDDEGVGVRLEEFRKKAEVRRCFEQEA